MVPLGFLFVLRKKLTIRLQEAAEAMQVANARNASLERASHQLQLELEDALSDLGKARSAAAMLDQKQLRSDKALADWKHQQEECQALLDASQKEGCALSTELLQLKHAYEESTMGQETLKRENKILQGARSSRRTPCLGGTVPGQSSTYLIPVLSFPSFHLSVSVILLYS